MRGLLGNQATANHLKEVRFGQIMNTSIDLITHPNTLTLGYLPND